MTKQSFSRGVACSALLLCASAGSLATAAPTDSGTAATTTSAAETAAVPTTSASFSDAKLERFADAYVAVQQVQKDAAGQGAGGDASGTASSDLQSKMKAAVEQTGLQVEEFNQIAQQMVTDLDLRSKVAEKVQARAGRGG